MAHSPHNLTSEQSETHSSLVSRSLSSPSAARLLACFLSFLSLLLPQISPHSRENTGHLPACFTAKHQFFSSSSGPTLSRSGAEKLPRIGTPAWSGCLGLRFSIATCSGCGGVATGSYRRSRLYIELDWGEREPLSGWWGFGGVGSSMTITCKSWRQRSSHFSAKRTCRS